MRRIFQSTAASAAILLSGAIAGGQPTPEVLAARVETKSFADRIEALGTLRANESVELTAKVTESVETIGFADGERVEKGALLVKLSSVEEEALLNEARFTEVESKRQYERAQQLAQQGATAMAQLDEARRVYETARSRVFALESRLNDLVIAAPFAGIVGLRNISVGALVQPGDLITTLDDDSVMKLDFSVPSTLLSFVAAGTPIVAGARAFAGEKFHGEIRSVDSRVDPVTRTVVVRAELPNEDRRLKPGLLMTVEILANVRETLVAPEEALVPQGRKNFVFVVEGEEGAHVARRQEVTIGSRREGEVEILSGLEEGDLVITHGTMRARDGGAVRVAAEDDGSTPLSDLINREPRG